MKRKYFISSLLLLTLTPLFAQRTPMERSGGRESATYAETMQWYRNLAAGNRKLRLKEAGDTDAGLPLHVALVSADGITDPEEWRRQRKVVILVINGIHAGEPDGIDASMMLCRDWLTKKRILPERVALAILPVYNIGGCLNRSGTSRVNQNGPVQYGFRGNSQNLDLNRDFTKCDSREAASFNRLFHWIQPDLLVDNHVSDGADYQYTMTLLTTQYEKLGPVLGDWLKQEFEPGLYAKMKSAGEEMFPYVNFGARDADKEMRMFFDPPRYSSGYAALFQTPAFVTETHMLKPFADRVQATMRFMQSLVELAAVHADELRYKRRQEKERMMTQTEMPLGWVVDSSRSATRLFRGYAQGVRKSRATGLPQLYYDRNQPTETAIRYLNTYNPALIRKIPPHYIVPQSWHRVIERLLWNGVRMSRIPKDTLLEVEAHTIVNYRSYSEAYEGHHKNHGTTVNSRTVSIRFQKGDYLIDTRQPARRYLAEMLEPEGDDSFFAWNFFDPVLQQKEGYSDYRWDELAAQLLEQDTLLQRQLDEKRGSDTAFAGDASAQLEFLYRRSPYFEPEYRRYPVYRLWKQP